MKLPSKWREAEFLEILTRKPEYGANAPSVPFIAGKTPRLIRITDIDASGRLIDEPKVGIAPDAAEGCEVNEGDILIARTGATVGKSVRIESLSYPASFAGYLIRFIVDDSKAINRFVAQFLKSPQYWQWVDTMQRAGAQPNINSQEFCSLVIKLPSLLEQRKIAEILGRWDEVLEKLDALIAAKDRRKQALLQQLITGRLRLRGFKSRAWKAVRMGDALERVFRPVEVEQAASLALVSIRRRLGGLFRRPDVLATEYKTHDLHAIKAGDFLISKRQVVHGAWAIVEPAFDGTLVSKEYAILVNRASEKLDMRFFAWLAQSPRMLRLARVASTGVHIEKLIFDPVVFLREQIRIPIDIKEQAAIAAVLDTANAELRLLREQRAAFEQQKRGLMRQLLTGRVRVKSNARVA